MPCLCADSTDRHRCSCTPVPVPCSSPSLACVEATPQCPPGLHTTQQAGKAQLLEGCCAGSHPPQCAMHLAPAAVNLQVQLVRPFAATGAGHKGMPASRACWGLVQQPAVAGLDYKQPCSILRRVCLPADTSQHQHGRKRLRLATGWCLQVATALQGAQAEVAACMYGYKARFQLSAWRCLKVTNTAARHRSTRQKAGAARGKAPYPTRVVIGCATPLLSTTFNCSRCAPGRHSTQPRSSPQRSERGILPADDRVIPVHLRVGE